MSEKIEQTNLERALDNLRKRFEPDSNYRPVEDEDEDGITDLIADLLHLAASNNLSPDQLCERALNHWREELEEDDRLASDRPPVARDAAKSQRARV